MNMNESMNLTTSLYTGGVWPDQDFAIEGFHEKPNLFYQIQLVDKSELFIFFYGYFVLA